MNPLTEGKRIQKLLVVASLLAGLLSVGGCRMAGSPPEINLGGEATIQVQNNSVPSQPITTAPGSVGEAQEDPLRAELIVCEIKGHVVVPGVYDLAVDSRVADLIVRSGGVLPSGSLDFVNQARKLTDGEVIVIPEKDISREEYEAMAVPGPPASQVISSGGSSETAGGLININTATEAELDTIPGVGPATAKNIIAYRTDNGPYTIIEDLKKVDRIGEKTFEKLKSYITVNP